MEVAFCVRHLFLALLMEFLERRVRFMSAGSICTRLLVLMPLYKFWSKSNRGKARPPNRLPLPLQSQWNVKNIWRFTWSLITYLRSRWRHFECEPIHPAVNPWQLRHQWSKQAARITEWSNRGASATCISGNQQLLAWRSSWALIGVLIGSALLMLMREIRKPELVAECSDWTAGEEVYSALWASTGTESFLRAEFRNLMMATHLLPMRRWRKCTSSRPAQAQFTFTFTYNTQERPRKACTQVVCFH
jgi:hypothetical protein